LHQTLRLPFGALRARYDSCIGFARIMGTIRRNAAPGYSSLAAVKNVHGCPGKQDRRGGVTAEVHGHDELLALLVPTAQEMDATARNRMTRNCERGR